MDHPKTDRVVDAPAATGNGSAGASTSCPPPDSALLLRPDGSIAGLNQEAARCLGHPIGDLVGHDVRAFLSPDTSGRLLRQIDELPALALPFSFEEQRDSRIVRTSLHPLRTTPDSVDLIAIVEQDVTAQRAAAAALRESEAKYHTLVEDAAEMLFLHDVDGRIVEVNRAAAAGTGYSREELTQMGVWDLDPDSHKRRDRESIWLKSLPRESKLLQVRHRRKDGTIYPAEVRLAFVECGGKPYVLALANDVGQRLSAELALRESERRLATLLSNLPGMAYRCRADRHWTMEYVSDGVFDLTGHLAKDLIEGGAATYAELIHPQDRERVRREIQEALRRDEPFTLEYRIVPAPAGPAKWVWERGRAIHDAAGQTRLEGFILDITARKNWEDAREAKADQEKRLAVVQKAESLNRMAGAIAHHFNNKMQAVVGNLEMAEETPTFADDFRSILSEAKNAALAAAQLSQIMLTCLGEVHAHLEAIDLAAICREIPPFVAWPAYRKPALALDLPPSGPVVASHPEHVRRILANLLANAVEAPAKESVRLRLSVGSPLRLESDLRVPPDWDPPEAPHALIEVSDDGPGVPPGELSKIFDPFYSTKFTGRGLGLPVALGLARIHGGGIAVRNRPGEGLTATVCLPLAHNTPQPD